MLFLIEFQHVMIANGSRLYTGQAVDTKASKDEGVVNVVTIIYLNQFFEETFSTIIFLTIIHVSNFQKIILIDIFYQEIYFQQVQNSHFFSS